MPVGNWRYPFFRIMFVSHFWSTFMNSLHVYILILLLLLITSTLIPELYYVGLALPGWLPDVPSIRIDFACAYRKTCKVFLVQYWPRVLALNWILVVDESASSSNTSLSLLKWNFIDTCSSTESQLPISCFAEFLWLLFRDIVRSGINLYFLKYFIRFQFMILLCPFSKGFD